jgi:hypothetical protein
MTNSLLKLVFLNYFIFDFFSKLRYYSEVCVITYTEGSYESAAYSAILSRSSVFILSKELIVYN